jgi:hypothetical protein
MSGKLIAGHVVVTHENDMLKGIAIHATSTTTGSA